MGVRRAVRRAVSNVKAVRHATDVVQQVASLPETQPAARELASSVQQVASSPEAQPEARELASSEFRVLVKKEVGQTLGLQINTEHGGALKVTAVQGGGLVQRWNEEHSEEERVRDGDWIVSVCGVSNSAAGMLTKLHAAGLLELIISRTRPGADESTKGDARRFPVAVSVDEDTKLGLDVKVMRDGLLVLGVKGTGLIDAWNRENPSSEVRSGDRIVFVNAVNPADMLAAFSKPGEKHMIVCRGLEGAQGLVLGAQAFDELPEEVIGEDTQGADVCGVCLEEWESGERVVRLGCGHHFHRGCCAQWLKGRSALCPLCQWAADCPRPCTARRHTAEEDEELLCDVGDEISLGVQEVPTSLGFRKPPLVAAEI